MKHVEIERKWLLDGFPDLPVELESEMEQGYLSFKGPTVRIRKSSSGGNTGYCLTIKGAGTLQRTEVELALDAEQYAALFGLLAAPPVRKRRRECVLAGGHTLECSLVDEGEPGAFYYAEVEFASREAAAAFEPPAFLGREVTEEPGWSMAEYTRRKAGRNTGT